MPSFEPDTVVKLAVSGRWLVEVQTVPSPRNYASGFHTVPGNVSVTKEHDTADPAPMTFTAPAM